MKAKKRALFASPEGNGITEGVIWQQLLMFFFPILLGTFFQQLYNTVDAIIVGKFVGKESLAAVGGATGNLINLLVGFFVGLSSGATVVISQFYGGGKGKDVSAAVHTSAALALGCGLFMTVVSYLALPVMLEWMSTPEEIMDYAVTYIRIFSLGMLPSLIYNIGSGILRAVGDSRRPLYFLICACMVNIVLDIVFVVGLGMGVAGAAWATILSQLVSAVLVIVTLCRSHQCYQLHPKEIRIHRGLLNRIIKIGFPAGLQSVMYSISNVIIQVGVNAFGTNVLAAWTAYGKLDTFYWMIVSAFGVSITTFVGQNFGAQRYDRVKKSVRICMEMTAAATVLLSAAIFLLGEPLLGLFSDDPEVITSGLSIIRTLVPFYITYICVEIFSGALRGAGDTFLPTVMTLTGICLLRIVWLYAVVPVNNTLTTVLLSYPITWTITSLMFIVYYCKGSWMNKAIQAQR
ncbi:MAG: MATE family efflux transporter [Eubacteriales bacterium]|nr:MATE family efflux transporter [Eubacteriales bacterium]